MPRKKNEVTDTTTEPTKRTLAEKIAATEALLAKYKQQQLTEAMLNNIAVGDDVDFTFGRADAKRVLTGVVVVPLTDDEHAGKIVGVESGEGFDKKVYKVRVEAIVANRTAAERDAPATEPANDEAMDPLAV